LKRNLVGLFVKPVEGFFIIERRDLLIFELLPSSRRNQKKDVKRHGPQTDSQTEDLRDQVEIDLRDGGVDLEFDAPFLAISIPRREPSKDPFTFRKASCVSAVGPSMLMLIR